MAQCCGSSRKLAEDVRVQVDPGEGVRGRRPSLLGFVSWGLV